MKLVMQDKNAGRAWLDIKEDRALELVAAHWTREGALAHLRAGRCLETPTIRIRDAETRNFPAPPDHDDLSAPPGLDDLKKAGVIGWWD